MYTTITFTEACKQWLLYSPFNILSIQPVLHYQMKMFTNFIFTDTALQKEENFCDHNQIEVLTLHDAEAAYAARRSYRW